MNDKVARASLPITVAVMALCLPAYGADLGYIRPPVAPPPLYNWTGLYVGANLGGAFGSETASTPLGTFSTGPSGLIGGGQLGYNFMFSPNWLLGIEGEIDGTSAQGNVAVPNAIAATTITGTHNWYDTLDGRLGLVQGPWLYYVKGGAAWMRANYLITANTTGVTSGSSVSSTRTGWTIGAGLEYMLSPAWSAKLEYDYLDFGTQNLAFGNLGISAGFNTQVHEIKLGINYHWLPGSLFGQF